MAREMNERQLLAGLGQVASRPRAVIRTVDVVKA